MTEISKHGQLGKAALRAGMAEDRHDGPQPEHGKRRRRVLQAANLDGRPVFQSRENVGDFGNSKAALANQTPPNTRALQSGVSIG